MGGCPAGPTQTRTAGPGTYSGKGAGAGSISVDWEAATPTPGTPAVTGYTVRAVALNGEDEVGKRLGADARSTKISGLVADEIYSVEIAAKSAAGEGAPSVISRLKAADHVVPTATANTLAPAQRRGQVPAARQERQQRLRRPPRPGDGHPRRRGPLHRRRLDADGDRAAPSHRATRPCRSGRTPPCAGSSSTAATSSARSARSSTTSSRAPSRRPARPKVAATPVSGAVDVTWPRSADTAVTGYRVQAYTGESADVATGDPRR